MQSMKNAKKNSTHQNGIGGADKLSAAARRLSKIGPQINGGGAAGAGL